MSTLQLPFNMFPPPTLYDVQGLQTHLRQLTMATQDMAAHINSWAYQLKQSPTSYAQRSAEEWGRAQGRIHEQQRIIESLRAAAEMHGGGEYTPELEAERQDLDRQRQQIEQDRQDLDHQRQQNTQDRQDLDRQRQDLDLQRQDLDRQRQDLDRQRQDLDRQRQDLDRQRQQIEQDRQDLDRQRQQIEQDQRDMDQDDRDMDQQRQELNRDRERLTQDQKTFAQSQRTLDTRTHELARNEEALRQARADLHRESLTLRQQHNQAEEEAKRRHRERDTTIQRLQTENKRLRKLVQDRHEETTLQTTRIQQLERDVQHAIASLSHVENERDTHAEKVRALAAEMDEYKEANKYLNLNISVLSRQLDMAIPDRATKMLVNVMEAVVGALAPNLVMQLIELAHDGILGVSEALLALEEAMQQGAYRDRVQYILARHDLKPLQVVQMLKRTVAPERRLTHDSILLGMESMQTLHHQMVRAQNTTVTHVLLRLQSTLANNSSMHDNVRPYEMVNEFLEKSMTSLSMYQHFRSKGASDELARRSVAHMLVPWSGMSEEQFYAGLFKVAPPSGRASPSTPPSPDASAAPSAPATTLTTSAASLTA
jgi:chromosome segregation ATPase